MLYSMGTRSPQSTVSNVVDQLFSENVLESEKLKFYSETILRKIKSVYGILFTLALQKEPYFSRKGNCQFFEK